MTDIMKLADGYAECMYLRRERHDARAALQSAIEALIAERDAYQQDADKMAAEHKVERETLERQIKQVRNKTLDDLSNKLKQSGATLPAKQDHEGGNAVLTGVSIALVVIEEMKEQPCSQNSTT